MHVIAEVSGDRFGAGASVGKFYGRISWRLRLSKSGY